MPQHDCEKLEADLKEFVQTISHDLRDPLRLILDTSSNLESSPDISLIKQQAQIMLDRIDIKKQLYAGRKR